MTKRLDLTVARLHEEVKHVVTHDLLQEFYEFMRTNKKSETMQDNHLKTLMMYVNWLGKEHPDKSLFDVDKKELVIDFLNTKRKSIDDDPDEKWLRTWNDYLDRIKYFYRWMHNVKLKAEPDQVPYEEWETPDFVAIKHQKITRDSPYAISETWELDEWLFVTKYEADLERRAAELAAWDINSRNHELCLIRRKDLIWKEKYAQGQISDKAKTGSGPFYLIVAYAACRDWFNRHPFQYPDARLFCDSTGQPIGPDTIRAWFYDLRDNITEMLKNGSIKDEKEREKLQFLLDTKKWNPYCLRHSSITYDSDFYPGYSLNKKVRWTMTSKQPARYIKNRMSTDLVKMQLARAGIITEEEAKPKSRVLYCGKCSEVNEIHNKLCSKCAFPLTAEAAAEQKAEEEKKYNDLRTEFEEYKKEDLAFKQQVLGQLEILASTTGRPTTISLDASAALEYLKFLEEKEKTKDGHNS